MISLCSGWEFTEKWTEEFSVGQGSGKAVTIPHNCGDTMLHNAGPADYEMICGYRRVLHAGGEFSGKRLFLQFDAAGHIATVYVNGKEIAVHRCGYTAFRVEITDYVNLNEDNLISVKLDCTENGAIPPFGNVIDYLTYGGLYREVWLDVRPESYIEDVFVHTPSTDSAAVSVKVSGEGETTVRILDGSDVIAERTGKEVRFEGLEVEAWDTDNPRLYECEVRLFDGGTETDRYTVSFGFRTAEFREDGFYLNGVKTFLRGLNRHQSFPYIGYAAPEHLQREDARILKEELHCNAVRTSHYPQSRYFIDECDRLGLLVFTEIPGWQHVGDDEWREQACKNTEEMVLQYRNHPSIILWGVRINESQDFDDFYAETNAIAHRLDPSRCTSGVRYLKKSSLLEDVYAFNDFSHTGKNAAVVPKKKVTPDMAKAMLISECNGHMFPTKSFDDWPHRYEHAMRHARIQDAAASDGEHAGCFAWCMFDYQTHKDFGSGDNICYHGVLDMFRNPKLAAAVYSSQGDGDPVLEVGTSFNIGDYPAGDIGDFHVFTNADEVRLFKNDVFVKTFDASEFKGLKHGPFRIDDLIGNMLVTEEGFDERKAKLFKKGLETVKRKGIDNLSPADLLLMLYVVKRYRYSFGDLFDLYGKYVGNWGGESTVWRFDAVKDGKTVAARVCGAAGKLHIEAVPSKQILREQNTYDMAAVRIRVADENGNTANYSQLPLKLDVEGPAEIVGPDMICAEGGMTGTYIRSTGEKGNVALSISSAGLDRITLAFSSI